MTHKNEDRRFAVLVALMTLISVDSYFLRNLPAFMMVPSWPMKRKR